MACLITAAIGDGCKAGVGGIVEILLGNFADFTAGVVVDPATGLITALPEATLYRIPIRRNNGGYTETINNETNLFMTQAVTANIFTLAPATRFQVMNVARGRVVAFVRTKSNIAVNEWVMCGRKGGLELTGTAGSGTAASDINGYQLTFTGEEEDLAEHLTAYSVYPFDNFTDITVSPAYPGTPP